MRTPICDFVRHYASGDPVRMHMPGHKGKNLIGPELLDITEIEGADVLYSSRTMIRESEENAAQLFGTARTVYSAEGSSLCIRAMLYLALLSAREKGIRPCLLAGRNAHRTLMTAAALLDLEIRWMMPEPEEGLLSCTVTAGKLEEALRQQPYMAVYLTSPDYLGQTADIRTASEICHRYHVPLLVDNAHGAYLKFLSPDRHPITLGADVCCDSAHKTLSCLTGAAYLHLSRKAPERWMLQAEQAMELFASTSPSWLILQSLDRMNRELAGNWPRNLERSAERLDRLKKTLQADGWQTAGDEPLKLTLNAAERGYTGDELRQILQDHHIYCEYADQRYLVLMPSADTPEEDWARLDGTLRMIPPKTALAWRDPVITAPEQALSIREAMLSPRETRPVSETVGRILADACVSCPPAVPAVIAGDRMTKEGAVCLQYYGVKECDVVAGE